LHSIRSANDDMNALGPREFADRSLDYVNDLVFNGLAWRAAGLERDVISGTRPRSSSTTGTTAASATSSRVRQADSSSLVSETMTGHVD